MLVSWLLVLICPGRKAAYPFPGNDECLFLVQPGIFNQIIDSLQEICFKFFTFGISEGLLRFKLLGPLINPGIQMEG